MAEVRADLAAILREWSPVDRAATANDFPVMIPVELRRCAATGDFPATCREWLRRQPYGQGIGSCQHGGSIAPEPP